MATTSTRADITIRIGDPKAGTAPPFTPTPPPVVPLALVGMRNHDLPLAGDAVGEARTAAHAEAEKIRQTLDGAAGRRLSPAAIQDLRSRLAQAEAQIRGLRPPVQEAVPVPPAVVVDRATDVPDPVPRGQDLFALDDSRGGGGPRRRRAVDSSRISGTATGP